MLFFFLNYNAKLCLTLFLYTSARILDVANMAQLEKKVKNI